MLSVPALIDRAVRWYGPRLAVVDASRALTFAEVGERSSRLAHALLHLDRVPGGRVALLLSNRLEFVEADFAIAKSAKVKVPINPRLRDAERSYIIAHSGAETLITERSELDRVNDLRREIPVLRTVLSIGGGLSALDYEETLAGGSATSTVGALGGAIPSVVLYTSGTTGRPKGATLSDDSRIAATMSMLIDEYSVNGDDGIIHAAPLSHGSGSKILAYFIRGARNILLRKFDPVHFFRTVEEQRGTSTFLVPTMIRMLLDAPERAQFNLVSLRNITYGGAPIPRETLVQALEAFGPILVQVYGSCEAPHPVTVLRKEWHLSDGSDGIDPLLSAGREATGVEVSIVDESGGAVPEGDIGELCVRGRNVMLGYWSDPGATADALCDGWYRTGDVARRDDRGFIYIVDRVRDMVISGGLNVYPAEVEAVLCRHPGIREACVVGIPDPLWGEVVAAFIVPSGAVPLDENEVIEHCSRHLAGYKKPRLVRFVDGLPKGPTGKFLKKELRSSFEGGRPEVGRRR